MADLSAHEYARAFDLAIALLDGLQSEAPLLLLTERLKTALHADLGICVQVRWADFTVTLLAAVPECLSSASAESLGRRCLTENPPARHYTATNELALPLPSPRGAFRSFVFARTTGDFTERDLALARRLQPFVVRLDRHLRELERLCGLAQAPARTPAVDAARYGITPRELSVLLLLGNALTAEAIGRRLAISVHTVNRHLENIYRKLDTHDRMSTVLTAQRFGLLPVSTAGGPRRS